MNSWNLTVQHQLSNDITVSVGYVGNVGRDLNMGYNLNEPIPGPGIATSRQPYFRLYGLTQTIFDKCDCEGSNYHSLQAQVVKRFSNNLSLIAKYTYQRAFDYGEFGTPTDQYNTRLDYGPASFNRTHVFTLGHTYFLPFGTGQHWMSNADGILGRIVSGWEWSGFTTLESGMPFSATLASNGSLNSSQSLRPNQVGGPFAGTPHDRNQWFNPAASAVPGPYLLGMPAATR